MLAEKSAQWMEKTKQSLIDETLSTLSAAEKAILTDSDLQSIGHKAQSAVLAGKAGFEERYKSTLLAHFCASKKSAVAEELLLALQEGKTFELDRCELAKKYNWGIHERKAFEEDWGFWLKAQHLDQAAEAEEAKDLVSTFEGDFATLAHENAPQDLLVKNPYYYLLKGNESLRRGYCSDALVSYERAIAMDPLFSVNAHYCKAHALLLYKENKGERQQQAYAALQQAKTLISNLYEPALMSFHALVSQEGTKAKTSKHVQQQLTLLNEQKNYIQDACKVIEKAQEKDHNVKLTSKALAEVFEKSAEKYYKAIHEAAVNGLTQFFTITEVVPTPWWSIIGVTLIAAAQLTSGFLLAACTGNTSLIAEGVSDLITAVKSVATGTFNWATWATQKAISIVVSLVSAGWNSVKEGCQAVKNTAKDLVGSSAVGASDKGVKFAARAIGTQLGKGALKECLKLSGQCLTNKLFMENWEQRIIKQVGDALTEAMLANPLVVAALAQDVTNGDNHWQHIFLQEGFALLDKQQDHVCLHMAKSIALGVAKNEIPCGKALFEVQGVMEMLDKLANYTDEFIAKFNKKVATHKQEIEQAEQANQASSSSQATSSQVSALLAPALAVSVEDDDIKIQGAACYSSSSCTPAAPLRVAAITTSTPASLADQLKSSIASELSGSIRANLIETAIGYGVDALSSRLFAQIDEQNKQLHDEVKTARDHRSDNNETANRCAPPKINKKAGNKPDQPKEPLSKSAKKTIQDLKYKDLEQDETVLAAFAGTIGSPILIADKETDKLKNVIGDKLKGKPIQLFHTKPSAEHPHGHFDPIDPNVKVTPTGKNSCWLDAAWAQLPPEKKAQFKDVHGLKDEIIQFMKDHPKAINKACQTRDRLEKIAPEDIRKGGRVCEYFDPAYHKAIAAGDGALAKQIADKWTSRELAVLKYGAIVGTGYLASVAGGPLSGLAAMTGIASALDPAIRGEVSEGNLEEIANLASYHLPVFGTGRKIYDAAKAGDQLGVLLNSGLLIAEGAGLKWALKGGGGKIKGGEAGCSKGAGDLLKKGEGSGGKMGTSKQLGPMGDPGGRSILHKPEGWITQASNNNKGTKIINPKVKDGSDYIRFSPKNPDPKAPAGQQYNSFQRRKNGKALTKDGQWVCPKTHPNKQDFHIPQDKFEEFKPLLDLD